MPTNLQGLEALSGRQKEVLRLTAQHLQAKEIARKLNITERTVRAHTESARHRLGAATSREAVRIFMAHEAGAAIVKNDQWSSTPISETPSDAPLSGHEQALSTPQRIHDDQLHTLGVGLANAGNAEQTPAYSGRDRDLENHEPGFRPGESDFQYGSGRRLVDGRWDEFRGRLKSLSTYQWLGLIFFIGILLPLAAGVLIQAAHATFEGFQLLHAKPG